MPLRRLDFVVELTSQQIEVVRRAVTTMYRMMSLSRAPRMVRCIGLGATHDMLNSGTVRLLEPGQLRVEQEAIQCVSLGTLKSTSCRQAAVYPRLADQFGALKIHTAFLMWRAPDWILVVDLHKPLPLPEESFKVGARLPGSMSLGPRNAAAPLRRKKGKRRKSGPVHRGPIKTPSPIDQAIRKIRAIRRTQRLEALAAAGIVPVRVKKNEGSVRIMRSNASVVSGGLPGLGKRK